MQTQQDSKSRMGAVLMIFVLSLGILLAFTIIKCRLQNKNLAFAHILSGAADVDLAAEQENRAPITPFARSLAPRFQP